MIDFKNFKMVSILDIADAERAISGKEYPRGCTLIALSMIRVDLAPEYLDHCQPVLTRYAVIQPHHQQNPEYIYQMIKIELPHYLGTYMTGINLQFGELKHLKIRLFNTETQEFFVETMNSVDEEMKSEQRIIANLKKQKEFYLQNMFPSTKK